MNCTEMKKYCTKSKKNESVDKTKLEMIILRS